MIEDEPRLSNSVISEYIRRFRFGQPTAPSDRETTRKQEKEAFWWITDDDHSHRKHQLVLEEEFPSFEDASSSSQSLDSLENALSESRQSFEEEEKESAKICSEIPDFSNTLDSPTINSHVPKPMPPSLALSVDISAKSAFHEGTEDPLENETQKLFAVCDSLLQEYLDENQNLLASSLPGPEKEDNNNSGTDLYAPDGLDSCSLIGSPLITSTDAPISFLSSGIYSPSRISVSHQLINSSVQVEHPTVDEITQTISSPAVLLQSSQNNGIKDKSTEFPSASFYLSSDDEKEESPRNEKKSRHVLTSNLEENTPKLFTAARNGSSLQDFSPSVPIKAHVVDADYVKDYLSDEIVFQLWNQLCTKKNEITKSERSLEKV
jgi:hypothetical protein